MRGQGSGVVRGEGSGVRGDLAGVILTTMSCRPRGLRRSKRRRNIKKRIRKR